jgi:hypothetical protein
MGRILLPSWCLDESISASSASPARGVWSRHFDGWLSQLGWLLFPSTSRASRDWRAAELVV